ncbi:hypothetical protein TWF696_002223 [Orbilia brochopaga]|uniref:Uncharacterized protein n=1 Tax=Orbilia brochopaga TaxID=3140254 RepID=A0AAV9U7W9_9PEZI
MEIGLIAPLVKTVFTLYDRLETCKDLGHSASALVAQIKALHRSIKILEETAKMRQLNRSFHDNQPLYNDRDPTEQQLGALLKDIDATHEKVEVFFRENGVTLNITQGPNEKWDVRVDKTFKNVMNQDSFQTRLRAFEQRYHALAITVSHLSNALTLHTIQESIADLQPGDRDHAYAPKQRLKDPSLLTRPRTVQANLRGNSECYAPGKRVSGYTESCAIEPAISEEQLQAQTRKTYSESQTWLFQQFENELLAQSFVPENFKIWYLLNKVLLWLGECTPMHSSLNQEEYAANYVSLMKAAWLLSEKIMPFFPAETNLGQFNESVLIEIQYQIHKLQPTEREPPSLESVQEVPLDILKLCLSPGEQANIARTETHCSDDPSEAVIFQRTVQFSGYEREKRLIKVIFDRNDFEGASPWFKSRTMIIDDQKLFLEIDDFTVQTKGGRTQYDRLQTVFTPVFPVTSSGGDLKVLVKGSEVSSGSNKTIEIEFLNQADIENFQHAVSGYAITKTM